MRGLGLASVGKGDTAAHLRPTTDRVRESIFNLLLNGGYADHLDDSQVLDLFAGTGALGLEALSRGAAFCTFVDSGRASLRLLKDNIARSRTTELSRVHARDISKIGENPGLPASLIFLDPPYGQSLGQRALGAAVKGDWVAPDALIVWEESTEQEAPVGFEKLDARRYGDTWVTLLRYKT